MQVLRGVEIKRNRDRDPLEFEGDGLYLAKRARSMARKDSVFSADQRRPKPLVSGQFAQRRIARPKVTYKVKSIIPLCEKFLPSGERVKIYVDTKEKIKANIYHVNEKVSKIDFTLMGKNTLERSDARAIEEARRLLSEGSFQITRVKPRLGIEYRKIDGKIILAKVRTLRGNTVYICLNQNGTITAFRKDEAGNKTFYTLKGMPRRIDPKKAEIIDSLSNSLRKEAYFNEYADTLDVNFRLRGGGWAEMVLGGTWVAAGIALTVVGGPVGGFGTYVTN